MGRQRKRWIDTVKECLRKRDLDVRQARKMVQDICEWWGFVRGECMGRMNPDLDEMPQLYEALEWWKSVCGRAYNLEGIKGKIGFSTFS